VTVCRLLVPGAVGAGGDTDHLRLEALDRPRLVHVQREPFGLALDDVGEHDRFEDVVLRQPLRRRRTVETGAYDGDLARPCHCYFNSSSFAMIASAYSLVPTAVGSSRVG